MHTDMRLKSKTLAASLVSYRPDIGVFIKVYQRLFSQNHRRGFHYGLVDDLGRDASSTVSRRCLMFHLLSVYKNGTERRSLSSW